MLTCEEEEEEEEDESRAYQGQAPKTHYIETERAQLYHKLNLSA